ncbi:integral membrane protein DUF92-domain-containing protein [Catenaria anguillulae PL171]|uniref:Integral membrane protein DUF92-domain-containing protein n=1 Tax=Catenaria anguillulae PL171 TaxID=765915 RepID=A0A1Y2HEV4_9FUNG|nr:integral membrane protein DUF92-domain-containing protein [Catenaria anguillulae PL171]
MQLLIAIILSLLLAVHGLRKKSLSTSGAAAGLLVGLITFNHPHPVFGVILVAFYLSGSRVTKIGRETKLRIEEDYREAGQRNVWQVVCNGGVGTLLALTHLSLVVSGNACHLDKPLSLAYLAYVATAQASVDSSCGCG